MRVQKRLARLAAAGSVMLLVAACGGGEGVDAEAGGNAGANQSESAPSDGGGGDGVLKLGYVLPETGQLASLGPPMIEAVKFARARINKAGGVLGKPIPPLVTGDEGDQQSVVVQSAQRVLNQDIDALMGAAASGQSLAIIDMVTGAEVMQCSGSNTSPTFTNYDDGGYYFRTAPSDAMQGPVLADLIISDGYTNVAILARADSYGRGLANATAKALEEAGATVAVKETYDPNAQTYDASVQSAVSSGADAVVVIAFEEGAQIIRGLISRGFQADQLYGADGLRNEELPELVAPNNPARLAGMKGTAPASAENEKFVDALKEFAPDLKDLQFAPQFYDCVMITALAAQAAGSDDPSVFTDKVVDITEKGTKCDTFKECKSLLENGENIDYQGASGPLDFIPAGEPGKALIEVYSFNKKGDLVSERTVQAVL